MVDKIIEEQVQQFQHEYGINLLDVTKAAQETQGCSVAAALHGLPEKADAEAFHLIGEINKENKKADPTVPGIVSFDELRTPAAEGNFITRGQNVAMDYLDSFLVGREVSAPISDLRWQGYHAMGLRLSPIPLNLIGEGERDPLVFESWNPSNHMPRNQSCTNYMSESDYNLARVKEAAKTIEEH